MIEVRLHHFGNQKIKRLNTLIDRYVKGVLFSLIGALFTYELMFVTENLVQEVVRSLLVVSMLLTVHCVVKTITTIKQRKALIL